MRSQRMKSRMENRREQKERNREWVRNPSTLDHSVASYDAQGSDIEPILFNPLGPQVEVIYSNTSLPPPSCQRASTSREEGEVSEKSEEKERDLGTEGKTPNPILVN